MPGKVTLGVVEGVMRGKLFTFDEHDTFIFGRMPDCHACLPDDQQVSRHHFIMEANPPDARVRDLGSLSGTYVNGTKYGGRAPGETPEQGAQRQYPEVDLKDGDRIKVGQTVISVQLQAAAACCQCNCAIAHADRERCAWIGGTFICATCKCRLLASGEKAKAPEPVRCQKCGKDVAAEIGGGRRGDYVCAACRVKAEADPMAIMLMLLGQGAAEAPEIPGYEVGKTLGIGGFGTVYLARRKQDNERVAIKVMLSKVVVDERARQRFQHEIELTKSLRHKHIVSLLDSGSAGSGFYFIMEHCDGGSVDGLMARRGGKLALSEAGPIILQALEGLAFAHEKDIVHRDLKPQNILLAQNPHPGPLRRGEGAVGLVAKLGDFGLAKNFEKAGFSGMTVTGSVAGTAPYMPREQVTNFKYVKPVSDVWSMGATFYHMLTGSFPLDFPRGKDPMEIILRGTQVPIRKRDSSVPSKVAEVIGRALATDVKARYQNAGEMRKALAAAL